MSEHAKTRVLIRQWPGLASNASPLLKQPGEAAEQINCRSLGDGVLESRSGFRVLNGWTTTELYGSIVTIYNDQIGDESQLIIHTTADRLCVVTDLE